jgi:hypothetical protein
MVEERVATEDVNELNPWLREDTVKVRVSRF